MTIASALISGNDPLPQLAERAVHAAMKRAGLTRANGVLLFLSTEFTRHAQPAVLAAARAARCTQIAGGIAAGLCTETGWVLDRPSAAAMVLGDSLALAGGEAAGDDPLLCCTSTPFPSEWADSQRYGLHFHGNNGQSAVWQSGRLTDRGMAESRILGARAEIIVSPGVQPIGLPQRVDAVRGYDLLALAGQPALESLVAALPDDWRERQPLPLHLINASIGDTGGEGRTAAVISANADGSLTLTEALQPGDRIAWGLRLPAAAAAEMSSLLADRVAAPDFALYFSCIGRGPYFHGSDDCDLQALCERFPGLPVLGAYGTGQIAFAGRRSRQLQNAVVTALFRKDSNAVQPQP